MYAVSMLLELPTKALSELYWYPGAVCRPHNLAGVSICRREVGAADPRFSHVEVWKPHPPSCDVAVGGVHGTVDLSALSGVTV